MAESVPFIPTAAHQENYLLDASGYKGWADTVFIPPDESAVVEIIRRATREHVPVTVVGARSGLTGAGVAQGGWAISLEKFNRIEIFKGVARAGAAVTLLDLRSAA